MLEEKVTNLRVKVVFVEGNSEGQHLCEAGLAAIGHSQFYVGFTLFEE